MGLLFGVAFSVGVPVPAGVPGPGVAAGVGMGPIRLSNCRSWRSAVAMPTGLSEAGMFSVRVRLP